MKKKRLVCFLAVMALSVFCLSLFAACGLFGGDDDKNDTPKEYTIQYTDEAGLHTLTVTENTLYSLETIPEKSGYKFLGLFDAQEGGNQYVLANGTAVNVFTDGKNIVLYPQFKANEYTVILDYQDAQVTGERQFSVEYASSLPALPKDLTVAHKKFVGWYTAQNCQGTKVADQYGLIPVVSTFNEDNFDLSQDIIYLYAGFEVEKYSVTCYFGSGIDSEEMQVEYNTPVSQVVPDTRVDGKAPIVWSQTQGGEPFTGKITSDTTLYALEYAPVIELDVNGGDKIIPVVARAGTSITLPTPTKDLAKFLRWEDSQGKEYNATTMPSNSVSLKAVWQGKLVFDENGGTAVDDISVAAGNKITLPAPEREGFIFAGWYTTDKEQYTATNMPSVGVALKAGWYKTKIKTIGNASKEGYTGAIDPNKENKQDTEWRNEFDLSDILPASGGNIHVKLTYKVRLQKGEGGIIVFGDYFYDTAIIGDSYVLGSGTAQVSTTAEREITFEANLAMKSNTLYAAHYAKNIGTKWDRVYFKRVSLEITYPDTSKLYL
ncbi:MAG: InlB B-repeat-containing protein [Clostridia bacterium]|nr:InlB B-repeat-containing protein [Clostridia bacterium]